MYINTIITIFLGLISNSVSLPFSHFGSRYDQNFNFVSREEWGAREPRFITEQSLPVPLVIIHHTYNPGACHNIEQCSETMRIMQDMHQLNNGWEDIGYNFAVGSDGVVYEGRGWNRVGAHTAGYNIFSVGIVLIGDWVSIKPPSIQIEAAKNIITAGIKLGYISSDYVLIGHRQVVATECPGQALFDEISTWDRFESNLNLT